MTRNIFIFLMLITPFPIPQSSITQNKTLAVAEGMTSVFCAFGNLAHYTMGNFKARPLPS